MNKERATTSKPKPRGFRKALKIVGIILGSLVGLQVHLHSGDTRGRVRCLVLILGMALLLAFATPSIVAHPGRTASDGCHYCRTNCARWGVPLNQRHCHGGSAAPTQTSRPATAAPSSPASTSPSTAARSTTTWYGIVVASEHRCSPYDSDDYRYPQSVEDQIIADLGGVYGPYTGRWFASKRETDIEHIVARSEAHDSGLCAADAGTRRRFASDLLNLTLASPSVNRHQKIAYDAADWLPPLNRCWYAARIIEVRRAYQLTIDRREAAAIEAVLQGCDSFDLVVGERAGAVATPAPALALYDDNRNGRITCAEARAHGIAPVRREPPRLPVYERPR